MTLGLTLTRTFVVLLALLLVAACVALPPEPVPAGLTGIGELDRIIEIVRSNDLTGLRDRVRFTQTRCTFAEGLGGPPKCKPGEAEGAPVEVLPFMGPEGSFLRREEIPTWKGPGVSRLVAVYRVSDAAYTEKDYPAGEYAVAFADDASRGLVTLQVTDGFIVRIDFGFGTARDIPQTSVEKYLLGPLDGVN